MKEEGKTRRNLSMEDFSEGETVDVVVRDVPSDKRLTFADIKRMVTKGLHVRLIPDGSVELVDANSSYSFSLSDSLHVIEERERLTESSALQQRTFRHQPEIMDCVIGDKDFSFTEKSFHITDFFKSTAERAYTSLAESIWLDPSYASRVSKSRKTILGCKNKKNSRWMKKWERPEWGGVDSLPKANKIAHAIDTKVRSEAMKQHLDFRKAPLAMPVKEEFTVLPFKEVHPSLPACLPAPSKPLETEDIGVDELKLKVLTIYYETTPLKLGYIKNEPQIPNDPKEWLDLLWQEQYEELDRCALPKPKWPEAFTDNEDILGWLATTFFASHAVERIPADTETKAWDPENDVFCIDLSRLWKYSVREGISALGAKAYFKYKEENGGLQSHSIEYDNQTIKFGSEDWPAVRAVMLSTILAYKHIEEHLVKSHLMVHYFAVATWKCLSPDHPIRRLLHPHIFGLINTNMLKGPLLYSQPGSFFPTITGLHHQSIVDFVADVCKSVPLSDLDPEQSIRKRNMLDPETGDFILAADIFAKQDQHYWQIVKEYVQEYIRIYYDDESLKTNREIKQWFAFLEFWTEGRLSDYLVDYTPSVESLTKLCSIVIYLSTMGHEASSNMLIDYIWPQVVPFFVPVDGRKMNVGCTQRFAGVAFDHVINFHGFLEDCSHIMLDSKAQECVKEFQQRVETEIGDGYRDYSNCGALLDPYYCSMAVNK